jgi:hypothetical protein
MGADDLADGRRTGREDELAVRSQAREVRQQRLRQWRMKVQIDLIDQDDWVLYALTDARAAPRDQWLPVSDQQAPFR